MVLFSGTTFCGNSPVDPSLLTLVHNEAAQLSLDLDDFLCQHKEEKKQLESQILGVQRSLEQLLELPQKVVQIEHDMMTLKLQHKDQQDSLVQMKQQMADLSTSSSKAEENAKSPTFFGALDRNKYFTGRVKELDTIEKVNSAPVAKRKGNMLGICGLGGCGKSSLAFEYAWRNLERYPGGVFVVNGESDDLMRASLQRIHGEFVGSAQSQQQQEPKPFEQLLTETLSWLGNLRDKWLLLVDNMDQKELSPCARTVLLGQWKSKASGDILVTSRRRSQALSEDLDLLPENCFELDPFSVDESVEFLKRRTGIPSSCDAHDKGERELAQELGGLPLALEQAAAYIKVLECSIQLYLEQYRSQKSTLLNARRAKPRTEIYCVERLAVQTTWLLNFNYIADDEKDQGLGKAAAFFMKTAAYLSLDEIPIDILNVGAPEVEHKDLKKRLEMPIGTEQIVDLLVRFSLFKRKSGDTLSVHRLVQETLRDRCDCEGETDEILSSAIRMMHQAFLNCVGGTDFLREVHDRLLPLRGKEEGVIRQLTFCLKTCQGATLEAKRWKKLSVNAFHLACILTKNTHLKPRFFCEESARVFCEAAFYCYSVGMENEGYRLQQLVFEILCGIKEPLRYYTDNELMKVTRILIPQSDSAFIRAKLAASTDAREKVNEGTGLAIDANQTDRLLEAIKVIAPKAREAFSRDDFLGAAELYTDVVKISNFSDIRGLKLHKPERLQLVPLGEILCHRGIAHLQMKNFETAVEDFNLCTSLDIQHYRGYYWKAYALCKLVESGRTEFISRAQAATALLHFKFAHSKVVDLQKLQRKFPGLLGQIEYKYVSQVSELKELERQFGIGSDCSNCPLIIILAAGHYDVKKMSLVGGHYYFVCPPGSSASITCINGLNLSQGTFLFENVEFVNPYPLFFVDPNCTEMEETCSAMTSDKGVEELCASGNFETLTFGSQPPFETELTAAAERNLIALIEANDVHSLVIDHCVIEGASYSGVVVKFTEISDEQRSVSVSSSIIRGCSGTGVHIQGEAAFCHISIQNNVLTHNLYGIVINSPSSFCLKKNAVFANRLSGIVAIRASEGRLLRNSLHQNGRHGVLLNKTNATVEKNTISGNFAWGIVCCFESNLQCKENVLDNNFCGGLRIIFNGQGKVLVQRCEFRENSGPAVFPTTSNELCQTDREWKKLITAPRSVPISLYVMGFLEYSSPNSETTEEFNSPLQLDNRVSDAASDVPMHMEPNFCSTCFKDLQVDGVVIECPNCHVARYCSTQCSNAAKSVHNPVCKSFLEANKQCVDCDEFRKVSNTPWPAKEGDRNRTGLSLCVVIAFSSLSPSEPQSDPANFLHTATAGYSCLLACPQQNLWTWFLSHIMHRFTLIYGTNLPHRMMDMKAACIVANFDSKSRAITVYNHRIFPLEKIPDAVRWVEKTLPLFMKLVVDLETPPSDDILRWKRRRSKKGKTRFR